MHLEPSVIKSTPNVHWVQLRQTQAVSWLLGLMTACVRKCDCSVPSVCPVVFVSLICFSQMDSHV